MKILNLSKNALIILGVLLVLVAGFFYFRSGHLRFGSLSRHENVLHTISTHESGVWCNTQPCDSTVESLTLKPGRQPGQLDVVIDCHNVVLAGDIEPQKDGSINLHLEQNDFQSMWCIRPVDSKTIHVDRFGDFVKC